MASAEQTQVRIEKVVYEDRIRLTLDASEAAALMRVLRRVGGDPTVTSRGACDQIKVALEAAGVKYGTKEGEALTGNLFFAIPTGNY